MRRITATVFWGIGKAVRGLVYSGVVMIYVAMIGCILAAFGLMGYILYAFGWWVFRGAPELGTGDWTAAVGAGAAFSVLTCFGANCFAASQYCRRHWDSFKLWVERYRYRKEKGPLVF